MKPTYRIFRVVKENLDGNLPLSECLKDREQVESTYSKETAHSLASSLNDHADDGYFYWVATDGIGVSEYDAIKNGVRDALEESGIADAGTGNKRLGSELNGISASVSDVAREIKKTRREMRSHMVYGITVRRDPEDLLGYKVRCSLRKYAHQLARVLYKI